MKARRLFEQVLKLNPYNSEALLGRADICLEVGDRRIARKTYERARELDYSDSYTRDKLRENFPNRSSLSTTNLGAVLQVPLFIGGMAIQSVAPQFGYGFLDRTGKMVFHGGSHSYYGDEFSEGLLACDRAYLNKTGNCEFCIPYQCGSSFSEGMAKVENRHKFGFIDRSGVCKIDLKFDGAKSFHEGFAPVKVGSSWGYVDSTGNVRIEPDFQDCLPFSNKRAAVKINGKIGFIDRDGNVVVEPKYDFAWSFSEDRAIVLLQNDKSGAVYQYCIDPAGKVVFDLSALQERYGMEPENSVDCVSNGETSISSISEGFAGLTDKSLKEIMFREGLVGVPLGSRWGFIDRTGKVVIEPQFDWVTQFSEGFSGVYKNWEGGFINHDGMMVIPGKYRRVEPFSEGRAAVLPKGNQYRYGFIDSLGKLVIRPGYEGYPRRFRDGLVGVGICNTWP